MAPRIPEELPAEPTWPLLVDSLLWLAGVGVLGAVTKCMARFTSLPVERLSTPEPADPLPVVKAWSRVSEHL